MKCDRTGRLEERERERGEDMQQRAKAAAVRTQPTWYALLSGELSRLLSLFIVLIAAVSEKIVSSHDHSQEK